MSYRCSSRIHWWDCDLDARCIRAYGHAGPHRDGVRWWDDNEAQVPQDKPRAHSWRCACGPCAASRRVSA